MSRLTTFQSVIFVALFVIFPLLLTQVQSVFVRVTDGTCESKGYATIYNFDRCRTASRALGLKYCYTDDVSLGSDVVEGCSIHNKGTLFQTSRDKCVDGDCVCSASQPCLCEDLFVVEATLTCAAHGHSLISESRECTAAANRHSFNYNWYNPKSTYPGVVDGCSMRKNRSLFLTRAGICKVGSNTAVWIPLLKGKANCQCSSFQPCACRRRFFKVTAGPTCEYSGYATIKGRSDCVNAAKSFGWKSGWAFDTTSPINDNIVSGCSLGGLLYFKPGLCFGGPFGCQCTTAVPCLCSVE